MPGLPRGPHWLSQGSAAGAQGRRATDFRYMRLLPGEARHGVKPAKTLRGRTMTGRAMFEFRFNAPGPRLDILGSRL